ncbi:glycosyltransferase family 2 protein [Loktanella sp. M215]|uniref:glycosyltransferase family 2 protein n=1 Tax=Loktanella sp. M215 TaxID=2675431 RepID=UPI001F4083E2|nr:glycosyltransferase [Loktanella sp. M215]
MPLAVVIIPHFNDTDRLGRCLSALYPQLTPDVQAIVVDNGSVQRLDALQQTYPDVVFVTESRKGAAMARNRGVAETTAPRLFFLDCDCVPGPDWVTTALAICDRADIIGGTITVFDETPAPRSGAEAFETVFAFDNRAYIEKKGFSVTANLLTTRRVFAATGDFRTGLSEDLDWCHRARAQGFTLVHDDGLRVAHPTRSDWTALRRKWQRLTDEAWGLQNSGLMGRLRWLARAAMMPLSILAHTPRILRSPALANEGERRSAWMTLARLRLARSGWMLRQAFLNFK